MWLYVVCKKISCSFHNLKIFRDHWLHGHNLYHVCLWIHLSKFLLNVFKIQNVHIFCQNCQGWFCLKSSGGMSVNCRGNTLNFELWGCLQLLSCNWTGNNWRHPQNSKLSVIPLHSSPGVTLQAYFPDNFDRKCGHLYPKTHVIRIPTNESISWKITIVIMWSLPNQFSLVLFHCISLIWPIKWMNEWSSNISLKL